MKFCSRSRVIAFACAFTLLLFGRTAAVLAAAPPIVSAASNDHIWFVDEEQRTGTDELPRLFRLLHHARGMTSATVSSEATIPALSQHPEAMAAWEDQLWIVNSATPKQEEQRREVFTVRVRYDATFDIFHHEPRDRLLALEPLPAGGRLVGFAATALGPVALLAPTERGTSSVVAADGSKPSEEDLSEPKLLHLTNGAWTEIPLPDDLAVNSSLMMGTSRVGEGEISLVSSPASLRESSNATLFRRQGDDWRRSTLPMPAANIRAFTHVLGECAVVLEPRDDAAISIAILRPSGLIAISEFEAPDVPWTVAGLASDLRLITRGPVNQVGMQKIDVLTGDLAPRQEFRAIRPSLAVLLHTAIMIAIVAAGAILGLFLGRWRGEKPLTLPEGWHVMGPFGRAMALAIDLIPGGLITMLVLKNSFLELVNSPISVPTLELALPYLMMAGLTLLHSGIWELTQGTSLGKSVLGAKVTDEAAQRLSTSRTLIRLAFKAAVLFVPILAFPTIINRRVQGLGERAAGAVVIVKDEQEQT